MILETLEICFAIGFLMGAYDCDWQIEIYDSVEEVNLEWQKAGGKGWVQAFNYPEEKRLVFHEAGLDLFYHEWKHVFCWTWYYNHDKHNHPTVCEPYPHFKVQE